MIENFEDTTDIRPLTIHRDEEKLVAFKATLMIYATVLAVLIQLGGVGYLIAKIW